MILQNIDKQNKQQTKLYSELDDLTVKSKYLSRFNPKH